MQSKYLFICFALLVLLVHLAGCGKPKDFHRSPDGKFMIEVYVEELPIAMPGQGGDAMAKVVLKDNEGKVLGRSTKECATMYRDLEINWDYENDTVWYGRAHGFNLKTGECAC